MSDLQAKFDRIDEVLVSHNLGLNDMLAAILTALGSAPTDTFATLITAINQTNTLLETLIDQNNTNLVAINNTLDIINSNASLNAQRMLTLMLQTACPCDTDAPLFPLPLDVLPTEHIPNAKCQRIQYFLDLWVSWVIQVGAWMHQHSGISSFQIANMQALTLLSIDITDSELNVMPTGTRDAIAYILNGSGSTAIVSAALSDGVLGSTMITDLRQALFAEDNAAAGHAAALSVLSAYEPFPDGIFSAMFYSGWANIMYSALPVVDASEYDGDLCVPAEEGCQEYPFTMNSNAYGRIILENPEIPGSDTNFNMLGNYNGYRIKLIETSHPAEIVVFITSVAPFNSGQLAILDNPGESTVVPNETTAIAIQTRYNNTILGGTVELCPSGEYEL